MCPFLSLFFRFFRYLSVFVRYFLSLFFHYLSVHVRYFSGFVRFCPDFVLYFLFPCIRFDRDFTSVFCSHFSIVFLAASIRDMMSTASDPPSRSVAHASCILSIFRPFSGSIMIQTIWQKSSIKRIMRCQIIRQKSRIIGGFTT